MRGSTIKPVTSVTCSTPISDILINVFGELPSFNTSLIDFKHSTFEQFGFENFIFSNSNRFEWIFFFSKFLQPNHRTEIMARHEINEFTGEIQQIDDQRRRIISRWIHWQWNGLVVTKYWMKRKSKIFRFDRQVVFDLLDDDQRLGVNASKDGLLIQSQSPFPTVKANCCVYRGRWMYEVQLRSKGIMQIGWCSAKCKFTDDTGIGDTPNSYGLDGSKQRLWNVKTKK